MSVFTIAAPDGRKIKIEASDEATAIKGAEEWVRANPKAKPVAEPAPEGLQPGSKEYADWALAQVKAGKSVPQVSQHSTADPAAPSLGQRIVDNVAAAAPTMAEAVPFVGERLREGLESARAGVQTALGNEMSPEDVATETDQLIADNPLGATAGSVVGTVAPFAAAGSVPFLARLLGFTGPVASRMAMGGLSGAGITFGDSLVRGDDIGEAGGKALIAGGLGTLFPAAEKGAGWLRDLIMGKAAPREAQNLARALRDDEVPVDQINQRLADLGPDAMLMDLGPNLQSQAGAVASVPGPGQKVVRDAVATRARGAPGRVQTDVSSTIGTGPEIGALREGIVQAQQAAAKPLYDSIRDKAIEAPPIIRSILQRPQGQQAIRMATDMAANDGYHFPTNGNVMTVGLADYLKRSLDDIASSAARAGRNNEARTARNMAKAITSTVDKLVPDYKKARDAFAGPAQVLDAIDLGATVFAKDMSPAQLRRELAALSSSERDGFLQGAQAHVEALMGNAVNEPATLRNMFKKGWNEAKLRILLGDGVADDLLKRIDRELTFGQTSNAVASNSETARRLASQAEVNPQTGNVSAPGRTFLGLLSEAFNAARNSVQGVRQPQINRGMAELHSARQLSPETVRMLQNGSRASAPAMVAPGAVGLFEERQRRPVEVTVHGGR